MIAEECARELCAGMDSTGAASPDPEQLARLVLVTYERLVSMMVEKVIARAYPEAPCSTICALGHHCMPYCL